MSSENKRFCKINFVDGKSLRFTYEPIREDEPLSMGQAVKELSQNNNFMFTVEGKLVIIPMSSVQSIEISPAPKNLPPRSIPKAEYLD